MRVVVDYGQQPFVSRPQTPLHSRAADREQVIVVRVGDVADRAANATSPDSRSVGGLQPGIGGAYETTEDARLLDAHVRAHEQAHQKALGPYAASGIELATRRGADGEPIAVGGRIKADLTPVPGDPRATLRKAHTVRRAALAAGSPSAADMRVAAEAYRMARDAKREMEARLVDDSA